MTRPLPPHQCLANWLKSHRLRFPSHRSFAEAVPISEGRLSQILGGSGGEVSAKTAIGIHRETGGAVPASAFRPDLWKKPADVPVGEARQ